MSRPPSSASDYNFGDFSLLCQPMLVHFVLLAGAL
jgi:hypothetical protein